MKTDRHWEKRQRVLADFGEFALRSENLDDVLLEACRLVSDALDTTYAKVLEIEEGGRSCIVKAGVGWRSGLVGHRLHFSERSSETYSLELGEPVISRDIRKEDRFDFAQFLIDHGVVSLINVPIFLPGGKPYGLLQVDSDVQLDFTQKDVEFLRTYATILGPVIDRLHKTHSLERAFETNKRLLRELQHRVKNHIGIIASLARVRARNVQSDEAEQELAGIAERIETLRLIHDQLYQAQTSEHVQLRPFLSRLLRNLGELHGADTVEMKINVDDADLTPKEAVPIGLIANEFATNSLKYAFGPHGGEISVSASAAGPHLALSFADNGKGLSFTADKTPTGSGTGMKLIDGLAQQLDAEVTWPPTETGTTLQIKFQRDRE